MKPLPSRCTRGFIRCERDNTFATVVVEKATNQILCDLPEGFIPDPYYQVTKEGITGNLIMTTGGSDVPGWLIRVNRLAQGLTQQQLLDKAGLTGNASTVNYWELGKLTHRSKNDTLPQNRRQAIYDALGIDHRPDMDADTPHIIKAIHTYLNKATKFAKIDERIKAEDKLNWTYKRIGAIININEFDLSRLISGKRGFSTRYRDKVYRLYASLPSLITPATTNTQGENTP